MATPEEQSDVNENEKTVEEQARHPVPPHMLEAVYRIREKLLRENKGQIFEDSAEAVRRMREERTRELEARRKPLTREKLERVLKVREEIMQDRNGKPFEDSTEIIRQMREERSRELADL